MFKDYIIFLIRGHFIFYYHLCVCVCVCMCVCVCVCVYARLAHNKTKTKFFYVFVSLLLLNYIVVLLDYNYKKTKTIIFCSNLKFKFISSNKIFSKKMKIETKVTFFLFGWKFFFSNHKYHSSRRMNRCPS